MKVEGKCHCGKIRYEAEVEPGTVGICHCADCQMLTGSAFRTNIQTQAECFRLLAGAPRRYVKIADSGVQRIYAFCGDCGSPVYACAVIDPITYSLRVGALKQRYELGRARAANLDEPPLVMVLRARQRARASRATLSDERALDIA